MGQAEGRDSVHDAEIGRFRDAALLPGHLGNGNAENLGGRGGMDIDTVPEGLQQMRVTAEVRHDPQFDLGIVGREDQSVRRRRDKGLANLHAAFGPDRDVLQVRTRGTQAAGGRKGLVERGMNLSICRGHVCRERFDIGAEQFLDGSEFQNLADDRMPVGQILEDRLVRGITAILVFLRLGIQFQFVEKDFTDLPGRRDVQAGLAGHVTYLRLQHIHLTAQPLGIETQLPQVHPDAVTLHPG